MDQSLVVDQITLVSDPFCFNPLGISYSLQISMNLDKFLVWR